MSKGKVLIVDDEQNIREVLKLQLEQGGFKNVLEAENGEDAIRILKSEDNMVSVGLILCDIRMPKVNGVEVVDFLKKEAPGIPIVVVTGYPDTELAVSLLNKGVKDYLVKPVKKEKLLEVAKKIVMAGKDFSM